jgi:antitoxin YefM
MAQQALTITEARERLTHLPEELGEAHEALAITRHGEPVLAVLPWELYEALMETLEVLGDADQMAALRAGIEDLQAGRTVPWEQVQAELGL